MATAVTVILVAAALLSSRPSEVRTKTVERVSTADVGDSSVEGLPSDALPEAGQSPGSTQIARGTTAAKGAVKAGSGAAPLVTGLGPGITADKIKLGFIIVENNQQMLSFYGVKGGATGDTRAQVDAVVNDLNSRGGVLGRKIEPVFRTLDATAQGDSFPGFCTAFTQDKDTRVFAVLSPWNSNAAFHACLAKAGTLYITDANGQEDQETFLEFKPYLVTGFMTSSRSAVTLAQALHQAGFFNDNTRLGVIRPSHPTGLRVYNQHFKPALASFGVIPVDDTNSGLTTTAGVMAVQRFSEKKINQVAFITNAGGPVLGFMTAAQSQQYFPRYGLASPDLPATIAQNIPPTQLKDAIGAGWAPGMDVFNSEGPPLTTAERRCLDIHAKAGNQYSTRGGEEVGPFIALTFCDMLWLFEEAGTKAGRTLNAAGFAAALAQLGTSHQTTATFGTNFAPGIFDGATQYRPLAYDDSESCRCWRYTGQAQTVPR